MGTVLIVGRRVATFFGLLGIVVRVGAAERWSDGLLPNQIVEPHTRRNTNTRGGLLLVNSVHCVIIASRRNKSIET